MADQALPAESTRRTAPAGSFVGREEQLAGIPALWGAGRRLITLAGTGGIGKSRLAWEVVRRVPAEIRGPACFCDLADAKDADGVLRAVSASLGVPLGGAGDPARQLGHALAARGPVLVLLDNAEEIAASTARLVSAWLELAPLARFLVTSRLRLGLDDEVLIELGPLPLPDGDADGEALQLFLERAAAVRTDFDFGANLHMVVEIVRALDGIPLALELAAAQLRRVDLQRLRASLPTQLVALGEDEKGWGRHGTLREAIGASWRQLLPWERAALEQASVFRGGFTREAASCVIDLDELEGAPPTPLVIETLRERSLLQRFEHPAAPGELRFRLYESVRAFAARSLGPAEAFRAMNRHAAFFLEEGERHAEAVELRADPDSSRWLQVEQENLLAVHERALAAGGERIVDALRAAVALQPITYLRAPAAWNVALLDGPLACASPSRTDSLVRARALVARGKARVLGGSPGGAIADFLEAQGLARTAGDAVLEARVLLESGRLHAMQGRDGEARSCHERALGLLADRGDDAWRGRALGSLGLLASARGEHGEAMFWFLEALEVSRRCEDRRAAAVAEGSLGNTFLDQGRIDLATERIERALAGFREIGDVSNEAAMLGAIGALRQMVGDLDGAREVFEQSLALLRQIGSRRLEALICSSIGGVFHEERRLEEARNWYEQSLAIARAFGERRHQALVSTLLGMAHAEEERFDEAWRLLDRAEALLRGLDDEVHSAIVATGRARLELALALQSRRDGDELAADVHRRAARQLLEQAKGDAAGFEEGRLAIRLLERAFADTEG